jgi:hypothetical protein
MFFTAKPAEAVAVTQFRKTCTYHGLDVHVSLNALTALKSVVDAGVKGDPADISERNTYTLQRRGLVRIGGDGEVIITQLGLLVIALAEAGDLITIRHSKEKVSELSK